MRGGGGRGAVTAAAARGALAELGLGPGGAGAAGRGDVELPDAADLRRAYRAQALRWHPDKCAGAKGAEQFQRVAAAYALLSRALREGVAEEGEAGVEDFDGFDDYCSSLPPEMADILEAALAGEDVRERLEALGRPRPPEGFGCYPFPAFDSRGAVAAPTRPAPPPVGAFSLEGVEECLDELRERLADAFLNPELAAEAASTLGGGTCEAAGVASIEGEAAWVGRARGSCISWFPNYELRVVLRLSIVLPRRPTAVQARAELHLDDTDDPDEPPPVRIEVTGPLSAAAHAAAEEISRGWARQAAPAGAAAFRAALRASARARASSRTP